MEAAKAPAQTYEEFFVPAMLEPCARELLDVVPPRRGERVLDVACGTGIVSRKVAALVGSEGRVVGVDLLPGMLAVASGLPPAGAAVEYREGDAQALELPDGSFDLVLCQQGLQFFPNREKAVREMRRVLAPAGRVGVAVWQGLERNDFFREMCEVEMQHLDVLGLTWDDVAAPFLLGDPEALRALLVEAGFEDARVEGRAIEARAASPETFVENVEFAYSVIVPQFAADRAAFLAFVDAVARDLEDLLARHRQGDEIVFPLHVNVAVGTAG